jgi:hypothetical protein
LPFYFNPKIAYITFKSTIFIEFGFYRTAMIFYVDMLEISMDYQPLSWFTFMV